MTDRFYFANLGADIMRCIRALKDANTKRYEASLARAYRTLGHIRKAKNFTLHEEGLLLLRGLACAKEDNQLDIFSDRVNALIGQIQLKGISS